MDAKVNAVFFVRRGPRGRESPRLKKWSARFVGTKKRSIKPNALYDLSPLSRTRQSLLFPAVNELAEGVVLHAELACGLGGIAGGENDVITQKFVEEFDVH